MISDFAGANEFLSLEVLNLLARQGSPYRVVEKNEALDTSLDGLRAVLFLDEAHPTRPSTRSSTPSSGRGGP